MTRLAHAAPFALALAVALAAAGACSGGSDDGKGDVDASSPVGPDAMIVPPPDASPPDATPLPPDAPADPCGGVTQHCLSSTTLEVCDNGELVSTNCGAQSQVCQADGSGGFECADPPVPGANTVSGKVEYEDRIPQPSGALGAIRRQPARGVSVSVVQEAGGTVLVTGRTADDGSYSLSYDAPAGTMVHVLAATTSDLATRPVKCVKNNNAVHGLAGAAFASAVGVTQNLLAKESAAGLGQAFNVFDQMVTGIDTVRVRMGASTLSPIVSHWQLSSTNGTFYNGSINLLGGPSDDDGYDDAVILHEFGHYVEAIYGKSSSPGGSHGGEAVDPRLGWSEGWATYFSSAARGNQFYMDSNSGGGFGDDLENTVVKGQGNGLMTQNMSEETVAEILWDIGDGPPADDDPRNGGDRHEDVMKVQTEYLHAGVTATRGVNGIDFVDFMDGWIKLRGTSTCAALRTIVVTTHTFPYDFNAPGAACP